MAAKRRLYLCAAKKKSVNGILLFLCKVISQDEISFPMMFILENVFFLQDESFMKGLDEIRAIWE